MLLPLPHGPLRVLVTHHPFLPAPEDREWTPMDRAEEALTRCATAVSTSSSPATSTAPTPPTSSATTRR